MVMKKHKSYDVRFKLMAVEVEEKKLSAVAQEFQVDRKCNSIICNNCNSMTIVSTFFMSDFKTALPHQIVSVLLYILVHACM